MGQGSDHKVRRPLVHPHHRTGIVNKTGTGRNFLLLGVMSPWTWYFLKASKHLKYFLSLPLCNTFCELMWQILGFAGASSTNKGAPGTAAPERHKAKHVSHWGWDWRRNKTGGPRALLQSFRRFFLSFLPIWFSSPAPDNILCYLPNRNLKIRYYSSTLLRLQLL